MIIRANNICLREEDKCKETRNIEIAFRNNGYPQTIIRKAQIPMRAEKEETEYKCTIKVPYSGHLTQK
uniref:Helix-turn-helix domain-containing protein n=1 Tax=Romanomermis culicivorax TaxID=13658 RepID=A0A915IL84_ROMCU